MKRLLPLLLAVSSLNAEENAIDQSLELTTLPTGEHILHWYGKPGRSYFVQVSDSNDPLIKWGWGPIIEGGNDEEISHEVGSIGAKAFWRLKYTDQVPGPGKTLDSADFDNDGLSNLAEIDHDDPFAATDPLNSDTDSDGLPDGWEVVHGLDPKDNSGVNGPDGDFDGDGVSNLGEFNGGTNPHIPRIWGFREATNSDGTVTYSWNSYAESGDWFHIKRLQPDTTWKTVYATNYGTSELPYIQGVVAYSITLDPQTDYLP